MPDYDKLLRDMKLSKRNYMLDDCPNVSRYIGKCIKAVKWCRKRKIRGDRAADILQNKLTPENFTFYTKRHK